MAAEADQFDEIGRWSEEKLQILREYASAYSTILANQPGFEHHYIDGFAGAGMHVAKSTGQLVPGSPLSVLAVEPSFSKYWFVERDESSFTKLQALVGKRGDVRLIPGDCNVILPVTVFPEIEFRRYRRALCLLDPYKLQLEWRVVEQAGKAGTIDVLINFPVMHMNRTVLWHDSSRVDPEEAALMTTFWGDESWREIAYLPKQQQSLFGVEKEKATNEVVVEAYCNRLRAKGGFAHVARPLAMRNSTNSVVYYWSSEHRN